jgi:hypothetical protein
MIMVNIQVAFNNLQADHAAPVLSLHHHRELLRCQLVKVLQCVSSLVPGWLSTQLYLLADALLADTFASRAVVLVHVEVCQWLPLEAVLAGLHLRLFLPTKKFS